MQRRASSALQQSVFSAPPQRVTLLLRRNSVSSALQQRVSSATQQRVSFATQSVSLLRSGGASPLYRSGAVQRRVACVPP